MSTSPADFDPHDPAFLRDPYPVYAQFRDSAPVLKVKPYGSWWVFRDADVRFVLDSPALFLKNDPRGGRLPPPPFDAMGNLPPGIFSMDPPRHDTLKATLQPMLDAAIGGMDAFAEEQARALIDAARGSHRIELVGAFAKPLPPAVLFRVLGVAGATAGLSHWVDAVVAGHDIVAPASLQAAAGTCSFALLAYFQMLAAGTTACPATGSLLARMADGVAHGAMSAGEAQATALNLAVAGYASTQYLLATGALNLLRNRDALATLRADPSQAAAAVHEMLRYDAPAQLVDRHAAQDLEIAGVTIAKGDVVTAVIGSANRDPARWADPDRFDIGRDNRQQLGFGDGIHYCLGAPLVELAAPAAIRTLVAELPAMTLAGTPQWQTDPYLRSVVNLPVSVG